ncbi:MAG: hypothetical protein PHS77_13040 [Gallionellaceae bacterium]|nr:hypothetical protein [Gallionellaceae bacterium]
MATFVINTDISTETSTIEVTIDPNKPMAVGRHRFRLVVVDDSGNLSKADEVEVIVADQSAPTAVLNAPPTVAVGASFKLDGSKSFDVGGGQVVKYVWTYLGQP